LVSAERARTLAPDSPHAQLNYSNVLRELGHLDAALAGYDSLIAAHPDFAPGYCNRAYTLLLQGEYERGFSDHEWRLKNPHSDAFRDVQRFQQPSWLGAEALDGKTVLIHAEQGFGDCIQFCRYATPLAEIGARVIIEAPRPVCSLLTTLDGVSEVVARGDALPQFDYHCPLMSLPHAFSTTLDTVPACVPYLRAETGKVRHWSEQLPSTDNLRVGLVWSGGKSADRPYLWPVNARRNIALSQLAVLRNPGIQFVSLQVGEPAESELAQLRASGGEELQLISPTGMLRDFSDTAALIQNLDLVVTVDTAVAHLAGALGRTVWILNRHDSCWRWLLKRADSPWYPTAKLYRQARPGDWAEVLQRVAADLADLVNTRGADPAVNAVSRAVRDRE
jgi:hypothetical protein